ncbi:hypothetical protein JW899_04225 [Candidatus Uhrbacteria bacterium]|nr:hypothetical protein [Candidatus Uhrbacteria bacterium]
MSELKIEGPCPKCEFGRLLSVSGPLVSGDEHPTRRLDETIAARCDRCGHEVTGAELKDDEPEE